MREMKDSGIEWIGKIPREWETPKIAGCFSEVKQKNDDGKSDNALQFKMGEIIRKPVKWERDEVAETYSNYTVVNPNVIMINGLNLEFDFITQRVAIVKENGIITSAYIAIMPNETVNPEYMCYLLKSYDTCKAFHNMGKGLRKILNYSELKTKSVLLPPLLEQHRIADFLDRNCAEIDAVIEKTKAAVEEYKKLKQSVITEAVTKGVRGPRPMKPSGVEWIGDVPEGWEADKVKHLFTNGKGLSITKENLVETGLPVISYGQIHSKNNSGTEITDDLLRYVDFQYQTDFPQCEVFQYDFVFADTSEDYDGCGNCAYKQDSSILFGGYHTIILHSNSKKDNKYFAYLFKTDSWRKQLREVATGVKLFTIAQKTLMNSSVIIPPESEQQEISDYLDRKCAGIDNI